MRIVYVLDLTMRPRLARRRTFPVLTSALGPDGLLCSHNGCQEKNEKRPHRGNVSTGRREEVRVNEYKEEIKAKVRMSVAGKD